MKKFWRFIKSIHKDHIGIAPLKVHGNNIVDPIEKAQALNNQFGSVFSQHQNVPQNLLPTTSPYKKSPDIIFTEAGVLKLLQNLKEHKAPGPDKIGPRVLKELASQLAPILTVI